MELETTQAQGQVPVTIMKLVGELDASNYLEVIARGKELFAAGTRDLLLDLSDLSFMASSGLVALHSLVLVMSGEEPPDPEHGWGAFHGISRDRERGFAEHFRLYNPQPSVARTLEITGFKTFVQVHTDLEAALASF
jgi:anti-anti-sigma regulatory factor